MYMDKYKIGNFPPFLSRIQKYMFFIYSSKGR